MAVTVPAHRTRHPTQRYNYPSYNPTLYLYWYLTVTRHTPKSPSTVPGYGTMNWNCPIKIVKRTTILRRPLGPGPF